MAKVLIIYGSTSGNTELVSLKVAEILHKKKHKVTLQRGELSKISDCKSYDLCILAAPTYEHGVLQEHMIPIHRELSNSKFPKKKFAIIGLGDRKYDAIYNVESANILEEAVKQAEGELLCPCLKLNGSPLPQLETKVKKWAEEISKQI